MVCQNAHFLPFVTGVLIALSVSHPYFLILAMIVMRETPKILAHSVAVLVTPSHVNLIVFVLLSAC
jgi:hypothetical protein